MIGPRYVEPVFRPPSEASSLILQMTIGCSWNRCTFCGMYRSKEYRVRSAAEVLEEVRELAPGAGAVRRVFLADGDALAAPAETLEEVLVGIRSHLPGVQRVGVYGDSRSILRYGRQGLARLRSLGLGIVYFGAETGDEDTLRQIRKGATVERQLEACHTVHDADLKLSLMVLLGVAGRDHSEAHARGSGRFLNTAAPTYGAALTVTPVPGTELATAIERRELELPDRWGMLAELRWMLEEMDTYRGQFHANHASNYLPLKLRLPRDRGGALQLIDQVLSSRDEELLRPEWARGL